MPYNNVATLLSIFITNMFGIFTRPTSMEGYSVLFNSHLNLLKKIVLYQIFLSVIKFFGSNQFFILIF